MERILERMVGGSRAAVLRALEGGTRSVGEVVYATSLSQPNVSNHLSRLRELGLVAAERSGRKVYYRITSPDLVRALLASPPRKALTAKERDEIITTTCPAFESAVLDDDHETARGLVDKALANGLPWKELYTRVFTNTLDSINNLSAAGQLTIDSEHAAIRLLERIISHVGSLRVPARRAGKSDVVVACVEGEGNELGARMVADFLSAERLNVSFLGVMPGEALAESVQRTQPAVLCVTATGEERITTVKSLAEQLKKRFAIGEGPAVFLAGPLAQEKTVEVEELGLRAASDNLAEFSAAVKKIAG